MEIIADLQIHGRYSRATSKDLSIDILEKWAKIKGVGILGCGDFSHPLWLKEIQQKLSEDAQGILWSKNGFPFIWQTEISLMYTQGGRGRRVHHLIYAPNQEVALSIKDALARKGRIDYDGRPIFGFSSIELVDMMRAISSDIEIVPAHVWTPWFGAFGSKSGFDSLSECFGDRVKSIHAIETGLSSDPQMNWTISGLDNYTLMSSSDAHSYWPWRLGREANLFDLKKLTYKNILNAIREKDGFVSTIEVDPNYGMYHFDGHRNCNISMHPEESRKLNNICPVCKKPFTVGVLSRVLELSDRELGFKPKGALPFIKLLPLSELIGAIYGINSLYSSKSMVVYNKMIEKYGSEYNILLKVSLDEIKKDFGQKISDVIGKNRQEKLHVIPGYDGVYGKLLLEEEDISGKQKSLGDFS